jgi:hypothetical protein
MADEEAELEARAFEMEPNPDGTMRPVGGSYTLSPHVNAEDWRAHHATIERVLVAFAERDLDGTEVEPILAQELELEFLRQTGHLSENPRGTWWLTSYGNDVLRGIRRKCG